MNKMGDSVKIYGMRFTIDFVDFDSTGKPTFYLRRNFDGSMWYTRSRIVTRFSHIKRIYDSRNSQLDKTDVMSDLDAIVRRI